MNYQQALSYLKRGKFFPFYLLLGKELLLKEHYLKLLGKTVLKDKFSSMNYRIIYGREFELSIMSNFLKTPSLFGGRKIFVIRGYSEIKTKERKKLLEFLEKFTNSKTKNILVIIDEDLKKDPLLNIIKKIGIIIEFDIPDYKTLVNWVKNAISGKGKKIEEDAVYLLLSHRGDELLSIKNEIDKLINYAGDKEIITFQMVNSLLGLEKGVTIFDLLNAIRKKEGIRALGIIEKLSYDEPLPKILYSLEGEIKRLIGVKILMEQGVDYNTVKQKMGLPSHVLNEILAHLPKFSKKELLFLLKDLYKVNLDIRENYSLGILPLENFIKKFIQIGNSR